MVERAGVRVEEDERFIYNQFLCSNDLTKATPQNGFDQSHLSYRSLLEEAPSSFRSLKRKMPYGTYKSDCKYPRNLEGRVKLCVMPHSQLNILKINKHTCLFQRTVLLFQHTVLLLYCL